MGVAQKYKIKFQFHPKGQNPKSQLAFTVSQSQMGAKRKLRKSNSVVVDDEISSPSSQEEYKEELEEEEEEDEESKLDTIKKLLQSFSKDQLISILAEAAAANPSIAADIVKAADSDPVQRKIFVHGLGWDVTSDALESAFKQYGPIEECNVVADKATGRSKGYGFVTFKTRKGALMALKEPQKKIGNRMAACQLASAGPAQNHQNQATDVGSRRLYVANVGPEVSVEKLRAFFAKFGEIEEGPLGLDRATGKFRGFAIFVYKSVEGMKKALEEPLKVFEGCQLQCSKAAEGRAGKAATATPVAAGSVAGMAPVLNALPNNPAYPAYQLGLNQALMGQSLNPGAVLLGQNPVYGVLNPMLGAALNQAGLTPSFPGGASQPLNMVGATSMGLSAGYGLQAANNGMSPSVLGGYGPQAALLQGLGAYQNPQLSQSSQPDSTGAARSKAGIGSVGTLPSYYGR